MAEQVPFIDREDELAQIDGLIREWDTRRALFINAPGGVGKTRLLQEVRQQYAKGIGEKTPLLVTDIIDFDDRIFHVPLNVGIKLAQMLNERLDERVFDPYLRAILDLHKMEQAGVSIERLNQEESAANKTFRKCFNTASTQQRFVLFRDTTDAVTRKDFWNHILEIELQLENCVLLVAGRNARDIGESLQAKHGEQIQIIDLLPLKVEGSESYLQQKQELMHIALEPDLAQKLLLLAGGRPILIDLAVEWRAREIPLDWLVESSLAELESLSGAAMKERQREFEYQLVHHIADTRQPIDWLTLMMSRVYPLDVEMIAEMLKIPKNEAETLFEEARSYAYVFVKSLPDGRISLHDEMRRMVDEYVWPEVDPNGDRRRRDSRRAAKLLERRVQTLAENIQQIDAEEQTARLHKDAQARLTAFVEREALERELWVLKRQQLGHALLADIDQGVETFVELFDAATRAYRFQARETLLASMEEHDAQLSPEQVYQLDSRRVKHLLDRAQYDRARELATHILDRGDIAAEQQIDMLIQRGNVEIRLGRLERGIADFAHAVQISQEHALQNWLVRGLNARGWAYRNQGNLELALRDYLEAYQLSLKLGDTWRTASVLNNMGNVYALLGDKQGALENSQTALELWEELNIGRGIGATYSTLGEIYRRFNELAEAENHYTKALDIFTDENDIEWMSTVRCGRAAVYWVQGKLENAEDDLDWSLEHGPRNLRPRILHTQAQIYLARKEFDKARRQFEISRKVSQEVGDEATEFKSFADLLELAWEFGEYDRWREFHDEFEASYAPRQGAVRLRLRGSCLRKLGDLAICNGDYDAALDAYTKGFSLIAKHEIHGPFAIGEQVEHSEKRIRACATGRVLADLGRDLAQFWQGDPELISKSPRVLMILNRWEREGESP